MLTAIFGLLGVVIGGLITASSTYMVEERRARREETKERRERVMELKRAARLVDEDIQWALSAVTLTINSKRWTQEPLQLKTWQEYRGLFASETTLGNWRILKAAARVMLTYNFTLTKLSEVSKWEIDKVDLDFLEGEKTTLQKARDALKPFVDLRAE